MRLSSSAVVAFLFASSVALAACGGDDHDHGASSSSGGSTACERDTRKDVYAQGLSKTGGGLTVKVLEAQPAPPETGQNTLTFQVLDAGGKPIDGATLTIVPFMPDHGHGSAVAPVVTPVGSEGKYSVSKVYLAMAGLWEIRVNVQAPGMAPADVTFAFCLEG